MPTTKGESLNCLNADSAKHCEWLVRVRFPRLHEIHYVVKATKKMASMKKFTCVLVGEDPTAYVRAIVKFDFNDQEKIVRQAERFAENTLWILRLPKLEPDNRPTYNPCPNTNLVQLDRSNMTPVLHGTDQDKQLAKSIVPVARLCDVLDLKESRSVDLAVYITSKEGSGRAVLAGGQNTQVMSIEVCDDSDCSAKINIWGVKCDEFNALGVNKAVVLHDLGATYKNGDIQLHFREQSFLDATRSKRLEELEAACKEEGNEPTQRQSVTTMHSSAIDLSPPATYACAAMLDAMSGDGKGEGDTADDGVMPQRDVLVQLMQAIVYPDRTRMTTKDKNRYYMYATVRDWSGSCQCFFLEAAVFEFMGVSDKAAAEALLAKEGYEFPKNRFNLRGLKRSGGDLLIGSVKVGDFTTVPNKAARDLTAAVKLCGPNLDGAIPCPVSSLRRGGFVNLEVKVEGGAFARPQTVLLFVEGTEKSILAPMGSSASSRLVISKKCKCLLAEEGLEHHICLRAYCGENEILTYSMGKKYMQLCM